MATKPAPIKQTKAAVKSDVMIDMVDYLIRAINDTDEHLAWERLEKLQKTRPEATKDDLVDILIRQKCFQAGAVGAVTAGTSLIPGGGTLITFTFGVAADLSLTLKMQAELVLEIAAVYGRRLRRSEKRQIILLMTGLGLASDRVMTKAGSMVAQRATERLAIEAAAKALPVISIAASAGKNILTTYVIGQRAQVYFSQGPQAVGDWYSSFKAVTGADVKQLIGWLAETTVESWVIFSQKLQDATAATIVLGQTTGEVMVVQADKMGQQVVQAKQGVLDKARSSGGATLNVGKTIGEGVAAGALVAGWIVEDAGQSVVKQVRSAAGQASGARQQMASLLPLGSKTPYLPNRPTNEVKAIANLSAQPERVAQITAQCDTSSAAFMSFAHYFSTVLACPFTATWHDPDQQKHSETVTVLTISGTDNRRGVLVTAQYQSTQRRILAEQLWAEGKAIAAVLADYRYWLGQVYG